MSASNKKLTYNQNYNHNKISINDPKAEANHNAIELKYKKLTKTQIIM